MKLDCVLRYECGFEDDPVGGWMLLFRFGGEGSRWHKKADIDAFLNDCGYRHLWLPDKTDFERGGRLLLTDPFNASIVRLKFGG